MSVILTFSSIKYTPTLKLKLIKRFDNKFTKEYIIKKGDNIMKERE